MHKYKLILLTGPDRTVEAEGFETSGDFVDFYGSDERGESIKILRVRAGHVGSIELQKN